MIYILTEEPYHDNGWIIGVYQDLEVGLSALKSAPDPSEINCNDFKLTEWDTEANKYMRSWQMTGQQVSEGKGGWNPVRVDFTFREP